MCRGEKQHQDPPKEILQSETFLFMSSGNNEIAEQELEHPSTCGQHLCFQGWCSALW